MRPPGHLDRMRACDVDHRGRRDQVVRCFEGRVALAENEDALIDEIARVDRDRAVELCCLYAGDRRDVWSGNAGRHDQASCPVDSTVLVRHPEAFVLAVARGAHDPRVVPDRQEIARVYYADIITLP